MEITKMGIVLLHVTQQLVTKGELTDKEQEVIRTMLNTGSTLQYVEKYLLKKDHIILGKDGKNELNVIVINELRLTNKELVKMFSDVLRKNNLVI